MGWDAWVTLAVIVVTVVILARDLVSPTATVLGATIALLVAGVITPAQAFSGFSNPAPITVAALYVLARAVERTGALPPLVARVLGEGRGHRGSLARLVVPTAAASAFLNNTTIVAMLTPQIADWAERRDLSPSRFLMPLSFAAIVGGTVTLIGTSTNIVVSGLLESAGRPAIGMFEITRIGFPLALAGIVLLLILAPFLLPERRGARQEMTEEAREFVVGMVVQPGGPLDGQTVAGGGLRHLQGVYLVEIERAGETVAPVPPTAVLRGGDRLTFVGRADLVVDLQATRGLISMEQPHLSQMDTPRHTFFEAVVGPGSPLAGKTLRDLDFRARYQAAVVAIHRAGARVRAKLGDVRLRGGDTLLLLADPDFRERWYDRNEFLLVSQLGGGLPARGAKAWVVGLVALGIVGVAGAGLMPILETALLGAVALVLFRVLTPNEAKNAVDLNVIVLIAAAFGLGAAMETTGLADVVAGVLVNTFGVLGPKGALLGLVLTTVSLTSVITNNAAAILMFPIALYTAPQVGLDVRSTAIAVAVAASASFLTPIGYQTNTMIYGPGGYRFGDYSRLGLPLTIVVVAIIVALSFSTTT